VTDETCHVLGVVTTGDFTRLMERSTDPLATPVRSVMTASPRLAHATELGSTVVHRMQQHSIVAMPVLDDAERVANAMPAYAAEAGGFIREAPDETDDFDLAWSARERDPEGQTIWPLLRAVDPTFTVNLERSFQARNAGAYEVEILVAPSRAGTMDRLDRPKPMPLPEQEWLLNGRLVDRVVICRDASPARIVAPDPRWFALQKLWLAGQPKRNPLKRSKDRRQGLALLDVVRTAMPQFPLDGAFEASLPPELVGLYADWQARPSATDSANW
jgi:CBS domain-containing protein